MEQYVIQTDKMRDASLSSTYLNVESTIDALNTICKRLEDVKIDISDTNNLEYVSDLLSQIVTKFGGKITNDGKTTITIDVTQDDIDNKRNFITLLSKPLLSNDSKKTFNVVVKKNN